MSAYFPSRPKEIPPSGATVVKLVMVLSLEV